MTKELQELSAERKVLIDLARHSAGVLVRVEAEPRTPAQSRKINAAILERICEVTGVDASQCVSFSELVLVLGHRGIRKNWTCDIAGIRGDLERRPV